MSALGSPGASRYRLPLAERGGRARAIVRPLYVRYYNRWHARWAQVEQECFVSFTFDDFPSSAVHAGGTLITELGGTATFYATSGPFAAGLYEKHDLDALLAAGHELGSHTDSHLQVGVVSARDFERDVVQNIAALERLAPGVSLTSFAYPFGSTNLRTQRRMSRYFASGRGLVDGINREVFDVNHLRANRVYAEVGNQERLEELVDNATDRGGWLLFYTHDVSTNPSPFGCTPDDIERLASRALDKGAKLLAVREVMARLTHLPKPPPTAGTRPSFGRWASGEPGLDNRVREPSSPPQFDE